MEVWRYKDRIRNDYIRRNLQVASIEEESYEFHLKWSDSQHIYNHTKNNHVQCIKGYKFNKISKGGTNKDLKLSPKERPGVTLIKVITQCGPAEAGS